MPATIIKPRHDLRTVRLVDPPPYGYLLFGATVAPPKGPPIVREDAARQAVLTRVSEHLEEVAQVAPVVRATGYRAVVIPPAQSPKFRPDLVPPRFDVIVLIEIDSPDSLAEVAASPPITALRDLMHDSASRLTETRAQCVKAIADVDKPADGTYLFNHWAATDRTTALDVFDHLAPWYQTKTGLQNSTVLQPIDDDNDFAFVNHARWDSGPLSVAAHQFLRPSFHHFVRPNLAANHIQVYPALYHRI